MLGDEPEYTITAERRIAAVDYIFLSRDVLRPVACLPVPRLREPFVPEPEPEPESDSDSDSVSDTTSVSTRATSKVSSKFEEPKEPGTWLPNDLFPSDHMSLVVVFDVDERLTPAVHAA